MSLIHRVKFIKQGLSSKNHRITWFKKPFLRTYISRTIEPPLESAIVEKPCTVLLMEDRAIYKESWNNSFHTAIPNNYGMSFASVSFSKELDFDQMLNELKADLSSFSDAVLIARGPLSSWIAQFYLESLSLKGLVMVDPISFDVPEAETITKLEEKARQTEFSKELEQWNKLLRQAQQRKLLLEPGVVPMIIMYSYEDPACKLSAMRVAKRHSGEKDSRFGDVPVKQILQGDNSNHLMTDIDNWIESVL